MALEGDLKDFSLNDLINLVLISKKKGALVFHPLPGDEWCIFFNDEGVINATHGENQGEKVLERLVTFKNGPFIFNPNRVSSEKIISKSHEELSMHLSMVSDIWNEIKEYLPPLDTDLVVESDYSEIVLNSTELKMILLVATHVKLRAIMKEEGKVGIRELEALSHLIRAGLVKPGTQKPVTPKPVTPNHITPNPITPSAVLEEVAIPESKTITSIKLTVVKSFSISQDMVQMDKNIVNNWLESNLFTGRVSIKGTVFLTELKSGLGKALVIADKVARPLGIKEGDEVEVIPYHD